MIVPLIAWLLSSSSAAKNEHFSRLSHWRRNSKAFYIAGILTTAKAWGQLMTCDQAERIADRAIRKARWPIGNIVTIAIIAAFIAVTMLALVLGRR